MLSFDVLNVICRFNVQGEYMFGRGRVIQNISSSFQGGYYNELSFDTAARLPTDVVFVWVVTDYWAHRKLYKLIPSGWQQPHPGITISSGIRLRNLLKYVSKLFHWQLQSGDKTKKAKNGVLAQSGGMSNTLPMNVHWVCTEPPQYKSQEPKTPGWQPQ